MSDPKSPSPVPTPGSGGSKATPGSAEMQNEHMATASAASAAAVGGPAVVHQVRLQQGQDFSSLSAEEMFTGSLIRHQLASISFERYKYFLDGLAAHFIKQGIQNTYGGIGIDGNGKLPPQGVLSYDVLRLATEAFLLTGGGVITKERDVARCPPQGSEDETMASLDAQVVADAEQFGLNGNQTDRLLTWLKNYLGGKADSSTPYLKLIARQLAIVGAEADECLPHLYAGRWQNPALLELIWSYWHEEGMLCQTMNAIGIRFQNRRSRPGNDPLAALEIDPLYPLNNLLWGWIQSEYRRLSVQRRAYEYDHHYGITLLGKAVPPLQSVDSRSKFLESFHSLLAMAHRYYEDASNTTVVPEAFPLLNALRDTHLVLAEGAHNQYGDMPWTARVEMLIEQWLLARPEMANFLRGRAMVPYQEPWMGQVDTMKKLQGWTDVSVTHFHTLAVCGEALLLAVRHGPWANIGTTQSAAAAWAVFWKPEVQRYVHAYKAVTGVDITLEPPNNTLPARLLSRRLAEQRRAAGQR